MRWCVGCWLLGHGPSAKARKHRLQIRYFGEKCPFDLARGPSCVAPGQYLYFVCSAPFVITCDVRRCRHSLVSDFRVWLHIMMAAWTLIHDLPGQCRAEIQHLALRGLGSSLYSEDCSALGASGKVIHSVILLEAVSSRASPCHSRANLWYV